MRKLIPGVAAVLLSTNAALATQSSIPFINADDVRAQGITGAGVTVAVIDTGVFYDHPGLVGRIAPGGDSVIGGVYLGDDGEDIWGDGHGTYMSLIIADQSGVAHDARILPVRVFGSGGLGSASDIIQGIHYVRFLRSVNPSIRVINLSLGGGFYTCPCDRTDSATQAYQAAISAAPSNGQVVQPGDTVHWTITATVSTGDNAGLAAISVDLMEDHTGRPLFNLPPADVIGTGMEICARPAGISNPDTGVGIAGYGGTPFSMPGKKALLQIGNPEHVWSRRTH